MLKSLASKVLDGGSGYIDYGQDGQLSRELGTLPSKPAELAMPKSHRIWDQVAAQLPEVIRTFREKNVLSKLPMLDVSEASLGKEYLSRASIILSAFAHAYFFHTGRDEEALPDCIRQPWEKVCARLGRHTTGRTPTDDFLANWQALHDNKPLSLNNGAMLIPYFGIEEERIAFLSVSLMEKAFSPAISAMAEAHDAILNKDDDSLIKALNIIKKSLESVKEAFLKHSPNPASKTFMDPVIWAQTFSIIGRSTMEGELSNSGSDAPLFHFADAFIGYETRANVMGSQMQSRSPRMSIRHREFVEALKQNPVKHYVIKSSNQTLLDAYNSMIESYAGENGLLGRHRRKVSAFIKLAFQSGRLHTNSNTAGRSLEGEGRRQNISGWDVVDQQLTISQQARLAEKVGRVEGNHDALNSPADSPRGSAAEAQGLVIKVSELARHNTLGDAWSVINGQVYNISGYMGNNAHPGGDKILLSCAGAEASDDYIKARHNLNKDINDALVKYQIGMLAEFNYKAKNGNVIESWIDLVFNVNNMKNVFYNQTTFKNEPPIYILDQAAERFLSGPFTNVISDLVANNYLECGFDEKSRGQGESFARETTPALDNLKSIREFLRSKIKGGQTNDSRESYDQNARSVCKNILSPILDAIDKIVAEAIRGMEIIESHVEGNTEIPMISLEDCLSKMNDIASGLLKKMQALKLDDNVDVASQGTSLLHVSPAMLAMSAMWGPAEGCFQPPEQISTFSLRA